MNPTTIYRIETDRLVLRCYKPSDASMLLEAISVSLEHIRPWMPWVIHEPTDLETKIRLLRKFKGQIDLDQDYVFGIFNSSETELIGSSGLHGRVEQNAREVGYWINVNHIRLGYASEAISA